MVPQEGCINLECVYNKDLDVYTTRWAVRRVSNMIKRQQAEFLVYKADLFQRIWRNNCVRKAGLDVDNTDKKSYSKNI